MIGIEIFFLQLSCRFLAESLQPPIIDQAVKSHILERLKLRELARQVVGESRDARSVSAPDQAGWGQERSAPEV